MTTPDPGVPTADDGRAIIDANAYMTLATADGSGRPWASPVWFSHRSYSHLVWVSRPGARHSRNIAQRPEVGIVVFDSTVPIGDGRGVYMDAIAAAVDEHEVPEWLEVFSDRLVAQGATQWREHQVTSDAQFRLYVATVTLAYVLDDCDQRVAVDLAPS